MDKQTRKQKPASARFRLPLFLMCCILLLNQAAGITAPNAARAEETAPGKIVTPSRFLSEELLPQKESQVINPQKATYKSFGIDAEALAALEQSAAEQWTLPVVYVSTKDQEYILSRTEYTSCIIDVFNCPEKWRLQESSAGIRVRGNSSSYYGDVEKIKENPVPYRIKFDKKTNMLGLNNGAKCKSWVLLKAGYDAIRNDIALRFGRAIMEGHAFCSDTAFVHVYVNDVYQGIYTLCEQCQVNEHRVNISEPPKGYKGIDIGYYVVLDNKPDYPLAFRMNYGKHSVTDIEGTELSFVRADYSIKSDVYTQGQIDFIRQYLNNVFEIVYQACEQGQYYRLNEDFELTPADFASPQETVENVLDIESVVNMYLLYEIMHDYDVGEGSFYMCVDFSENSNCRKVQFTSPWDFNWTCKDSTERYWAGAFCEAEFIEKYGDRSNPWFVVLIKQDWFRNLVMEKWSALSARNAVTGCVEEELNLLEAHKADFKAWRRSSIPDANKVIDWLQNRLLWMDTQFLLPDIQDAP